MFTKELLKEIHKVDKDYFTAFIQAHPSVFKAFSENFGIRPINGYMCFNYENTTIHMFENTTGAIPEGNIAVVERGTKLFDFYYKMVNPPIISRSKDL